MIEKSSLCRNVKCAQVGPRSPCCDNGEQGLCKEERQLWKSRVCSPEPEAYEKQEPQDRKKQRREHNNKTWRNCKQLDEWALTWQTELKKLNPTLMVVKAEN